MADPNSHGHGQLIFNMHWCRDQAVLHYLEKLALPWKFVNPFFMQLYVLLKVYCIYFLIIQLLSEDASKLSMEKEASVRLPCDLFAEKKTIS